MKKKLISNPLNIRSKNLTDHGLPLNSNLFIIRHAESNFNKAIHDLESKKNSLDLDTFIKMFKQVLKLLLMHIQQEILSMNGHLIKKMMEEQHY